MGRQRALPPPTPGVSIPLAVITPLWGSRGHRHPRPGSWYRTREREREGREGRAREREREGRKGGERERLVRGLPTPGNATRWSSASWMACVSDVGRWHWTHSAVPRGSRVMNCSSTTRSITSSTSRGKHPGAVEPSQTVGRSPLAPRSGSVDGAARGYGRRVAGWPASDLHRPGGSQQVTVGRPPALPPSTVGSGAPATGCAPSHTPPLFSQRGPRWPPGHRVDPSSSAGRGRSMGL